MKTVLFRVDGNQIIATGHVMRCLSVAKQIERCSVQAVFVTADDSVKELITGNGYRNIVLNTIWNDMEDEINSFEHVISECFREDELVSILIDSYYVTEKYLNSIKEFLHEHFEHAKLFYMDDLNSFNYPVDALINYNIYGENMEYDLYADCKKYLGTMYAPLREEFINISTREFSDVKKIMITSGGSDEYDVIGHLLEAMLKHEECKDFEYYCVLGRFNKNKDRLEHDYRYATNVHLLNNVNNMSKYMNMCDVAITAGGSTCYELCACGIPAVLFTFADNQLSAATTFDQKGIIAYAGDVRTGIDICIANIILEVLELKDRTYWESKSRCMQSLVDGKGANRLAKALIE